MADIFISYASEDRNRVRPLAEALQKRGFSVWWDRALGAGQDYAAVIERELRNAKAVIVTWTRNSAASTFVRDEAGRARDEGRLVPVLLDQIDIPLGFGAFQAEDFTKWNGSSGAAQMQILEEVLRAKLEGRDIDGGAVARKRRRLMGRIRVVSLLSVVALIVVIAVGVNTIINPQESAYERLIRLVEEGALTPEEAIRLAQLLEPGALPPGLAEASAPGGEADATSVSEAEFDAAARETYQQAMQQLLTHPNAEVRSAAVELSQPERREQAIQTLWDYARTDEAAAPAIYRVCGAVGEANAIPLGQRALEVAATLAPEDTSSWRMLSYSYQRARRADEAAAAALVSEGVAAEQQGQQDVAEQKLQQALPNLAAANRAFVSSRLGEYAERRNDLQVAAQRYEQAYQAREEAVQSEAPPAAAAKQNVQVQADARRLVSVLERTGRSREACERLEQAQREHGVEAPDESFIARCQERYQLRVLPRAQLQEQLQTPLLRVAPREEAPAAPQQ